MAAFSVRGVNVLHEELQKAKDKLKDVDDSIKKITGRDPGDPRPGGRGGLGGRGRGGLARGRGAPGPGGRLFNVARMGLASPVGSGMPRRSMGGPLPGRGPQISPVGRSRRRPDDEDEDDERTGGLQSSVVPAAEPRARLSKSLEEVTVTDKKGRQRNQRMFGLLMGTLQQFKSDEKKMEDKEQKRKQIEAKLERAEREDQERAKVERSELFEKRRQKQQQMKQLEQKLERVQSHEDWEKQTRQLMNFIRTESEPHIFYRPKMMSSRVDRKMNSTKALLEAIIQGRRRRLEEEIEAIKKSVASDDDEEEEEDDEENEMDLSKQEVENGESKGKMDADDKENMDLGTTDVNIDVIESHDRSAEGEAQESENTSMDHDDSATKTEDNQSGVMNEEKADDDGEEDKGEDSDEDDEARVEKYIIEEVPVDKEKGQGDNAASDKMETGTDKMVTKQDDAKDSGKSEKRYRKHSSRKEDDDDDKGRERKKHKRRSSSQKRRSRSRSKHRRSHRSTSRSRNRSGDKKKRSRRDSSSSVEGKRKSRDKRDKRSAEPPALTKKTDYDEDSD